MKKVAVLLCLLTLLFPSAAFAAANQAQMQVFLDGQKMNFPNKPIVQNGTTLVPFRNLFEALGISIQYDQSTKTITATKQSTTVILTIGQTNVYKNGKVMKLSVPPQGIKGVTYVPLRFVSQSFNYGLELSGNEIYIISPVSSSTAAASGSSSTVQSSQSGTTTGASDNLTVEQIGEFSDRVVYIEALDSSGTAFASGSGVIVGSSGEILTNYHVIEGAASAKVYINETQSFTTSYVTLVDKDRDLALLQINTSGLPAVSIGDSSALKLGQTVVAIGSPLGFTNTLSTGNVSATSRTVEGSTYIQFTAPIDHGSSGGALFNMHGELVGITSAAIVSNAEINLAIPSNDVKTFLQQTRVTTAMSALSPAVSASSSSSSSSTMTASELQSYLNNNYGSLTFKDLTLDFDWSVFMSDDNKTYLISGTMYDGTQWSDWAKYQAEDSSSMPAMLYYVLTELHDEKGITNAFIGLDLYSHFSSYPSSFPASSITSDSSGYTVYYNFIYGAIDYESGYFIYNLDPESSDSIESISIN